jgi:glutathione synthase/RimK-type ligase-like ATP-grasp enzyme
MILLCGIPSEPPLAMVAQELERQSVPTIWFNQRRFEQMEIDYHVAGGRVTGVLQVAETRYPFASVEGIYLRTMNDRLLPELINEPDDSPVRRHCARLHDSLLRWCDIADACVVNRPSSQGSNFSKPYQTQIIAREGFSTPETLITNDPESALEFIDAHERVIYKSISGLRSIVRVVDKDDLERLGLIRWCPVQFQAFVEGTDLRVHVVGEEVFATEIRSDVVDYRYASQQRGERCELRAVELDIDLATRCVRVAQALDLGFAGIDLRVAPSGEVTCFEVNPSPAFSYYELATGQRIARAVAQHLALSRQENARSLQAP